MCNNTIGSFICSCNDGFLLAGDGRTCDGRLDIKIYPCTCKALGNFCVASRVSMYIYIMLRNAIIPRAMRKRTHYVCQCNA